MAAPSSLTFGIEEEVFITEPVKPAISSLFYLAKLLIKDPRFYFTHTASNFARGQDLRFSLMSGVEISTGIHTEIDKAIRDLALRRKDLIEAVSGNIVAMGHLIDTDTPTNVCALQIHLKPIRNIEMALKNLRFFLPLLTLLTVSSPFRNREYFGRSYRMASSYAIGGIHEDQTYRYQDAIITKRLGTIELRIFDPTWDLKRIRELLKLVVAVASTDEEFEMAPEAYDALRAAAAVNGYVLLMAPILEKLQELAEVDLSMIKRTPADEIKDMYLQHGVRATYEYLNDKFKESTREELGITAFRPKMFMLPDRIRFNFFYKWVKGIAGLLIYYLPRSPYVVMKYLKEKP